MTPLALLACAVLSALSTQAKVVTDFTECERFFYKGTEPSGMDQNAVKICQKYNNQFHFATLYSPFHRTPLYSAYTFDWSNLENTGPYTRPSTWFIEPQLGGYRHVEMGPESQFDLDQIKKNQAVSSDYSSTGYDRGHLLPNSYLSTRNRRATFTLTNVAPMNPDFNRIHWKQVEQKLKYLLRALLLNSHPSGEAYIITGAVPHENDRIPKRQEDPPRKNRRQEDYERVTVPTHVWTAVCFVDVSDPQKPFYFSFGVIGKNSEDRDIKKYLFPEMSNELSILYSQVTPHQKPSFNVFADECRDQNTRELTSTWLSLPDDFVLQVLEMDSLQNDVEQVSERGRKYNYALFETSGHSGNMGHKLVQCQYIEKSDPEAMTAADGTRSVSDEHYCKTENGFKLCCTTPCQDHENNDDYWCYSGRTKIPCSPQYSTVTISNWQCREDHPCGRYGEDYYWCRVSGFFRTWDYCSPPLRNSRAKNGQPCRSNHACAKYGSSENWCYTDADNNQHECCTRDDCYSAINGKTCTRDWPCGKHGYNYLWCYTTGGSWDYCCKEC